MKMAHRTAMLLALLLAASVGMAEDPTPLLRDEVASFKKKLVASFEALGQPPASYAMEREHFNLPTDASKVSRGTGFWPVSASAEKYFTTQVGTEKQNKDFQKEYEKKMLEAQAKGDYQAMAKLSQEMQQKASQLQMKAAEVRKDPINVSVAFNSNPGTTIDPDAVVFEKPGVIALRSENDANSGKARITISFDPVALKETRQLSRVDLKMPEGGVSSKTAVLNITVTLSGLMPEVEEWAKRIDTRKVLAQISGR
jgi:hypothetical protein